MLTLAHGGRWGADLGEPLGAAAIRASSLSVPTLWEIVQDLQKIVKKARAKHWRLV